MTTPVFDDELLDRVESAVSPGEVINTLGIARPNRVVSIDRHGILVETERSTDKGTGSAGRAGMDGCNGMGTLVSPWPALEPGPVEQSQREAVGLRLCAAVTFHRGGDRVASSDRSAPQRLPN